MRLESLFFRDTFEIKADYGKLATYFKTKLNDKYFKGFIDKDEIQLFYFSGSFKKPLSENLPIVQLNIANKIDVNGMTKIKFKLVDFFLILFGLANGSIIFFSIFNINEGPNEIPPQVPPFMLAFTYGFLQFVYQTERARFKHEIKQLELLIQ